jgi:hypothetical protein
MAQAKRRRRKGKKIIHPIVQLVTEVTKQYAAKQKISIRLTPEQMEAILKQWRGYDPYMPAEITFYAGRREAANIKVAAYSYSGDTCCA